MLTEKDLIQSGVIFDEEAHTYELDGLPLQGITGSIVQWMFPSTYENIPDHIMEAARVHGNFVHDCIEMADTVGSTQGCPESNMYLEAMALQHMRCIAHEYIVTDGKQFASPIDLVLVDEQDNIWLADIKTTSKLHEPNVRLQLSVYAYLFEKQNPHLKVHGVAALWLPKKDASSATAWNPLPLTENIKVAETIMAYNNHYDPAIVRGYYESLPSTVPSQYVAMIEQIAGLEQQAKEIEERKKQMREILLAVFKEHGVKKFDNDIISIAYIEPAKRAKFDNKAFRNEYPDLYEQFTTETTTEESIRLTIKKQKAS